MISTHLFSSTKLLSLSLLLIVIALSHSVHSQATSQSTHYLKTPESSTTQLIESAALTNSANRVEADEDTDDEDDDGMFSVIFGVLSTELADSNFYAALIMSFIYSPIFAILAFAVACIITVLLGTLYVGNLMILLPKLLISYLTAAFFIVFSGMTAYLIYTMKDAELATEKSIKKDDTEAEQGTFVDYTQEEEENFLSSNAVVVRQDAKPTSGFRKIFSFELFKTRPFRFAFAAALLTLTQLGDDSLRKIVKYREDNSFLKVFLGALIGFLICACLIAAVGFLLKEIAFRKFKLSLNKTKTVKYIACGALVVVGCLNVIIDLGNN